jgi:glycosyltransferase involved in cell wall biosynthesis
MKLSVMIIAYNHEAFIAKALDSVLAQKTDFDFDIVIGDDCSTDSTREILVCYKSKHPSKIKLLLPEKNLGMMKNFLATLGGCQGEYIALLEGDDYWTSPDKLQRQVDLLDSNKEYAGSFHDVEVCYDEKQNENHLFYAKNKLNKIIFDQLDFAGGNFVQTCSVVYRSNCLKGWPETFMEMPMGDWPLFALIAQNGSFVFIDEVMSAYRVHSGGVWSCVGRKKILTNSIIAAKKMKFNFGNKFALRIERSIRKWNYQLLREKINHNDSDVIIYVFKTFVLDSFDPFYFIKSVLFIVKDHLAKLIKLIK